MTHSELEQFKTVMHHPVTITRVDDYKIRGLIQPWSQTTVYLTPLENCEGEAIKVLISEIKSIQVDG